jgi:3-methyladenine DNA glycosylase AlkD
MSGGAGEKEEGGAGKQPSDNVSSALLTTQERVDCTLDTLSRGRGLAGLGAGGSDGVPGGGSRRVYRVQGFDPDVAAAELTAALRALSNPVRAAQEKRYLKSDLEFFGVAVPDVRRTVKAAVKTVVERRDGVGGQRGGRLDRETAVAWALALWSEPLHERRMAAVEILQLAVRVLESDDLAAVEQLIRESRTWAYVDALAGNVAGGVALRDPDSWTRIDEWASDGDFWVRRSALLTLLPGIRADQPELERFVRYSEPMVTDKEFFIRKAIGWVLREISRRNPQWVAAWTDAHVSEISGVTFREAVRRLPSPDKIRLEQLRP